MPPRLTLGLLLLFGLAAGLLASRVGLPRVPAYVIAGVPFSPSLLGTYLAVELAPWSEQVTWFALGVIAYLIGGSITYHQLQRVGRVIGLALALTDHPVYAAQAAVILNLILASTFLYELVGPLATRYALQRAGELGARRRRAQP